MASSKSGDRCRLDGFEAEIFKLVKDEATSELQWKQWLRVPLEHAAATGNLNLFTRLMDAGADGKAGWRGCHGRTLLGAASYGNSEKMVRALLTAGTKSDVNVLFGTKHESALHVAAARGAERASKALMIAGADPNLRDSKKSTPLHLAAEAGRHEAIGSLLLKGADVHAERTCSFPHHAGETPLAASKGHTLCISELLLGGADVDVVDVTGQTPLYKAVVNDHLGAVEELLAAGANYGVRANNSRTPLQTAASRGHPTILKAFLDADSSAVHATDDHGWTTLHSAAASVDGPVQDNGDAVRVLLEAGADVSAVTSFDDSDYNKTPLHIAVYCRASIGTIRALLKGGANINERDGEGMAPLHGACKWSSVAAVEILLRWGADETLTDDGEETPADVIGFWEDSDIENEADNKRIRQMLARAPADRSWRRRGWLVLIRSCPTRVQIANGSTSSISKGCSAKVARVSGEGSGGDDEETEDEMMVDLRDLVGRIVGLEADVLFWSVVGFL